MANTPSSMVALGTLAPAFNLPNIDGSQVSLDSYVGSAGYLVMFICNHCPFVVHIQAGMVRMAKTLQAKKIAVFAINANDIVNYPQDHPDRMVTFAQKNGFTFPYLFDATQATARAYQAACTPDFFLYDAEHHLVYRGQMDASRPSNALPNDGADLLAAADNLLAGKPPLPNQRPSIGCNIKWL